MGSGNETAHLPEREDIHGGPESLGLGLHAGSDLAGGRLPEEVLEGVDEPLGSDVAGATTRGVKEERVVGRVVLLPMGTRKEGMATRSMD